MNQRLALLSAILANLDDDLPRLVYADWLEESGTTDADTARVEFIRLGCKSKAKSRITPAETKWLDANWQRLLGNTLAARPKGASPPRVERDGRFLRVRFRWTEGELEQARVAELCFEYVRGFARRVEYLQGHAYQRFWQATATDEPLAFHRPELPPDVRFGGQHGGMYAQLLPTTWGEEVFTRASYDRLTEAGAKVYVTFPHGTANPSRFHPLAVADEPGIDFPQHRQRAAVATAMTALAREFVGLTSPSPAG